MRYKSTDVIWIVIIRTSEQSCCRFWKFVVDSGAGRMINTPVLGVAYMVLCLDSPKTRIAQCASQASIVLADSVKPWGISEYTMLISKMEWRILYSEILISPQAWGLYGCRDLCLCKFHRGLALKKLSRKDRVKFRYGKFCKA